MARCLRVCFLSTLLLLTIAVGVLADSAQLEMTDPVLPVGKGHAANGTAFLGWVGGGHAFNTAGNLGGTFPIGSIHRGEFYFNGDMFTWIRNPRPADFRPRRIIFTLEPGYNLVKNDDEYRFFIKHQSYHNVDFVGPPRESYEMYGFSYRRLRYPLVGVRVGKYLNRRTVDYDWDFTGSVTFALPDSMGYKSQLHGWIHHVTESGNSFGRNGFTDYAVEYSFTINGGLRMITRYEFLHDIESFGSRSDHHVLVGPMYTW